MVFQSLDDLKDACIEAAEGDRKVTDFEVGVFCGKYKTEVPKGYFQSHSHRFAGGKKRKNAFTEDENEENGKNGNGARKMSVVASSGPGERGGQREGSGRRIEEPGAPGGCQVRRLPDTRASEISTMRLTLE